MMDLYNLTKYNARLQADHSCSPSNKKTSPIDSMSMGLFFEYGRFEPKELNFTLLFDSEYPQRDFDISKFLYDLNQESSVKIGPIEYKGAFVAEKGNEGLFRGELQVKGIVLALEDEVTKTGTSITVDNKNRQSTPVTLIATGAVTINGLSEKPIKTTGGVTIHDDGRILKPDGTNGSNLVEFEEFPHLKEGVNTITSTGSITIKYRPRLI